MTKLIVGLINFYRRFIRPTLQFRTMGLLVYSDCVFQPSCSDYALSAIDKYGPAKGIAKSTLRVLRCNPWAGGGVDLP